MTVDELRKKLELFPGHLEVYVWDKDGRCYEQAYDAAVLNERGISDALEIMT